MDATVGSSLQPIPQPLASDTSVVLGGVGFCCCCLGGGGLLGFFFVCLGGFGCFLGFGGLFVFVVFESPKCYFQNHKYSILTGCLYL